MLNELGDQAGQHELIAENLSTTVVLELATLVKQLKDDRRKVRVDTSNKCQVKTLMYIISAFGSFLNVISYKIRLKLKSKN